MPWYGLRVTKMEIRFTGDASRDAIAITEALDGASVDGADESSDEDSEAVAPGDETDESMDGEGDSVVVDEAVSESAEASEEDDAGVGRAAIEEEEAEAGDPEVDDVEKDD